MLVAPYEVLRVTEQVIDGAMTTGIVPESASRTTPATSSTPTDTPDTRGNLLARARRFPASPTARPKAAASTY
jgi:hypothetical protein